ncbi:MAG: hypothetical protein Q8K79_22310 [Solirubrobacteraceae bacterium]|nr:hypothetical protein [Solirubrobacteraceae bacterium]
MTEQGGAAQPPDGAAPAAPVEAKPLNAFALAKEVVLERLQNLLEWLLRRLKRYRAKRGDWWEK